MPMPFATTQLAARIEAAECRMLSACAEATAQRRPEFGVMDRSLAGGTAVYAGPDSPMNKVAGLGFAGPVDERELEEVERKFASHGTPVQVELASLGETGIAAMLSRRGYVLAGFENVLGRALPWHDAPLQSGELAIETAADDAYGLWADVVLTGFATPDTEGIASHESFPRETLERVIGDLASAKGFVRHLARRDGELAGGASMRVAGGIAQLCGAATLPRHRRRGVQTALLAARLAHASERGCELAVVTTLPGSKSQQNVQRFGFEVLYTRAILVRGA